MKFNIGDKVRLRNNTTPISIKCDQEVDASRRVLVHAEAFGGPENFYVNAEEIEIMGGPVRVVFSAVYDGDGDLHLWNEDARTLDLIMLDKADAKISVVVEYEADAPRS